MKREDRENFARGLRRRLGHNEFRIETYGPDVNKKQKPVLDIRVGFNEETDNMSDNTNVEVKKMSKKLVNEFVKDNIRLREENEYLKSLIEDIRNEY
tara:strand:- start:2469 stop:2759 length:291 start_codon:yes stop_codon:yes gene_type:complete